MPISLTVAQFIADARIGATAAELDVATRRLAYAEAAITRYLGTSYATAPDAVLNEAATRLAAYQYDTPTVAGGAGFANALRNSGVTNILLPYRIHGLGYADAVERANEAVGTVGNPVTGLAISGDVLTVIFADGTTQDLTLPAGMGGGGTFNGVDQTARTDAANALTAAADAQHTADTNRASLNALPGPPTVPDVPDVYTRGNNEIIPKPKITNAAPNQYLVISNVGSIIGITGAPNGGGGGGGGGGSEALDTLIRLKDLRTRYNFGGAVVIDDLTITANNFAADEKWLILYHVNFTVGSSNSNSFRATATLKHGSGVLDTSYIEEEGLTGGVVTGGTATGIAVLNLIGAPEDITVEASWSSNINVRDVESGTTLLAIKLSGLASGSIDEGGVDNRIAALVASWAFSGNSAEIPDDKLPVERFVPDASGATDGQVAKVSGGVWSIGDDAQGEGGGGGLSASGVTGLTGASGDEVHSNAIFPGVFGGVLRKFSFSQVIGLMRSSVGLGRQINPGGSTSDLGKVPVLHEDGANFHYQLQKPAELPTIASAAPTNPAHLNTAILYKDTPEGETATELYYKRRHDRESVIIAMNDTSPRSFGTEHRSFGWTSISILDTAEPVPGATPYPSAPTHWEAFIRSQNIASGLLEWRLYTDEMFSSLTTIYLDMRDQNNPDLHIQNVAMTKPVNEAYWTSGTYTSTAFRFTRLPGVWHGPLSESVVPTTNWRPASYT